MEHTIIYRSAAGEEVWLVMPWGDHSGRIPPPEIVFYFDQKALRFIYQGSK